MIVRVEGFNSVSVLDDNDSSIFRISVETFSTDDNESVRSCSDRGSLTSGYVYTRMKTSPPSLPEPGGNFTVDGPYQS